MTWEQTSEGYRYLPRATGDDRAPGFSGFEVVAHPIGCGMQAWRYHQPNPQVLEQGEGLEQEEGPASAILQVFRLEGRLSQGPLDFSAVSGQYHVRVSDLIMSLPYDEQLPTGVECYWRPHESITPVDSSPNTASPNTASQAWGIEWFVSANTRLLDEQIEWTVASTLRPVETLHGRTDAAGWIAAWNPIAPSSDDESLRSFESHASTWEEPMSGQHAILMRLADGQGQVLLATAPGDQRQLTVTWSDSARGWVEVRHQLEMGFLEKGVIRRARLFFVWLPTEASHEDASEALQLWYRLPQPLTV